MCKVMEEEGNNGRTKEMFSKVKEITRAEPSTKFCQVPSISGRFCGVPSTNIEYLTKCKFFQLY